MSLAIEFASKQTGKSDSILDFEIVGNLISDVLNGLVQCGYFLFNSGVEDYNNQNYDNYVYSTRNI